MAVLDATSIVNPALHFGWVHWPPNGARDVPCAFVPEMPNPLPGTDQATLGYPITAQYFDRVKSARADLRLYAGSAPKGTPVECHVTTPERPLNIECVPPNAYCLIPKRHLRKNTTYTVVAKVDDGESMVWRFRTR